MPLVSNACKGLIAIDELGLADLGWGSGNVTFSFRGYASECILAPWFAFSPLIFCMQESDANPEIECN